MVYTLISNETNVVIGHHLTMVAALRQCHLIENIEIFENRPHEILSIHQGTDILPQLYDIERQIAHLKQLVADRERLVIQRQERRVEAHMAHRVGLVMDLGENIRQQREYIALDKCELATLENQYETLCRQRAIAALEPFTEMRVGDLVETLAHNIVENELPWLTIADHVDTIMGRGYWMSRTERQRVRLENAVARRNTELYGIL